MKIFDLEARGTTVAREVRGGTATFLTMAPSGPRPRSPRKPGSSTSQGRIPGLSRLLVVDSVAASIGGLFGASSVTSYIESAAGVSEGARTGLHSLVVAGLFAVATFAAPLAGIVPAAATAPALIAVGFLLCKQLTRVDFAAVETALRARSLYPLMIAGSLAFAVFFAVG